MKWLTFASVALPLLAATACGSSDSESELLDLQTAESMAREEIGEDAVLFSMGSDIDGLLRPDGFAWSWGFAYRVPSDADPDATRHLTVTADEVTSTGGFLPFPSGCTPEESLQPLDSRVVVPDAVRRLEETDNPVRLAEGGRLSIQQIHDCWYVSVPITFTYPVQNAVQYDGIEIWSQLEYDDDGRFVSLFVE
ncbi:MAG: hypothetical protein WBG86_21040 [Polyangiales bacterium]